MRSDSRAILISEEAGFGFFRARVVILRSLGLLAAFLEIDAIKCGGDALKPRRLLLSLHNSKADDE